LAWWVVAILFKELLDISLADAPSNFILTASILIEAASLCGMSKLGHARWEMATDPP